MNQRAFMGGGWTRGGTSEVVRRAHPASGAQWNVQVVRGKVNGKCLWNACKALSLGLLLMVLGAAMATIGYYADHLSIAQEVRGNHTVRVKNESRGFHLNNLSYAGPIVKGVGGFIVVAACVMTFEARDSAAKVVPARFKLSTTGPPSTVCAAHVGYSRHGSLRTSGSQTGTTVQHTHQHSHCHSSTTDRRAITQSFMHFSRGLALETQRNKKFAQSSTERSRSTEQSSPTLNRKTVNKPDTKPKTFAACALLNPGLLHRHALSVDETAGNYSQGSMAMDLHLECPVTLRIRDRRRNPLRRQRRVEEDAANHATDDSSRRSSHSCSPRMPSQCLKDTTTKDLAETDLNQFFHNVGTMGIIMHLFPGGSAQQLPTHYSHCPSSAKRRSSNASDCTHRSRARRRRLYTFKGSIKRAISSDSRLTGAIPKCYHHHDTSTQNSTEQEPGGSSSDTDIRHSSHTVVHFSPH
ncbi:hypothetical protein NQ314_004917 [Rhamnusium bicolor]|uniref:Uncharacterized protein n=1 Tax=Rhamnusium bicolor TaxID=1586634 RepID=A0AAV8ZHV2_9CUCU|nr:hypothetical protein NQ314_004917 [Rhamnusium bicolor]